MRWRSPQYSSSRVGQSLSSDSGSKCGLHGHRSLRRPSYRDERRFFFGAVMYVANDGSRRIKQLAGARRPVFPTVQAICRSARPFGSVHSPSLRPMPLSYQDRRVGRVFSKATAGVEVPRPSKARLAQAFALLGIAFS